MKLHDSARQHLPTYRPVVGKQHGDRRKIHPVGYGEVKVRRRAGDQTENRGMGRRRASHPGATPGASDRCSRGISGRRAGHCCGRCGGLACRCAFSLVDGSKTPRAQGGRVWAESEGEGKGITFCFTCRSFTCRSRPRNGQTIVRPATPSRSRGAHDHQEANPPRRR